MRSPSLSILRLMFELIKIEAVEHGRVINAVR